jgi:hypothetical protein
MGDCIGNKENRPPVGTGNSHGELSGGGRRLQEENPETVGPPKNEETNPISAAPDDDIPLPGT